MNTVLFDFESIIDIKLGVIIYLKNLLKDGNHYPYLNKEFLSTDIEIMKIMRIYERDDIIRMSLLGEAKEQYKEIYKSLLENNYQEIVNLSPLTNMLRLINTYKRNKDAFRVSILCKNSIEKQFIDSKIIGIQSIINNRKDVDISNYGRIILSNPYHALEFNDPKLKDFLILNFGDNFDINNRLPAEVVIMLGDINTFTLASVYSEIEEPKG